MYRYIMATTLFGATTTSIGHIYNVLKALNTVASKVSLSIVPEGLKFSVDTEIHTCQAHLFLMTDIFSSFELVEDEELQLQVSLVALTECLKMFVQSGNKKADNDSLVSTCTFYYQGEGHPFILYFKEGGNLVTKCELDTFDMGDEAEYINLDKDNIVQQIITKGEILYDVLKELETMKTDIVTLQAQSLVSPHYLLISRGDSGTTSISLPNEKAVMETFDIAGGEHRNVIVKNSYNFKLISKCLEALLLASRVSIRCDDNGIMSIQSMCPLDNNIQSFIDFRFHPSETYEN